MNSVMLVTVFMSASLVFIICTILVLHKEYLTDMLRTGGLGGIAIAAFARAAELIVYPDVHISPVGVCTWLSAAAFFVSHYRGFTRRCARKGPGWYADPDRTQIYNNGRQR